MTEKLIYRDLSGETAVRLEKSTGKFRIEKDGLFLANFDVEYFWDMLVDYFFERRQRRECEAVAALRAREE